jgi:23S rRNA pseudoU1915 N3-methylase RlmH
MNAEEIKQQLRKIFGERIIFNKDFNKYAEGLKQVMQERFVNWCKQVKEKEIQAIPSKTKEEVLVFVKKIGSTNRCIVLKIVNDEFKEIHLADHDYYNKIMKNLGLKKSSNTF